MIGKPSSASRLVGRSNSMPIGKEEWSKTARKLFADNGEPSTRKPTKNPPQRASSKRFPRWVAASCIFLLSFGIMARLVDRKGKPLLLGSGGSMVIATQGFPKDNTKKFSRVRKQPTTIRYPIRWDFPSDEEAMEESGRGILKAQSGKHSCKCLSSGKDNDKREPYNFRWLHIPKTGTSFILTLWFHATGLTQFNNRRTIDTNTSKFFKGINPSCSDCYDFAFMQRFPLELYGRDMHKTRPFARLHTSHEPLGRFAVDQLSTTNLLVYFREPHARVVSAFDDNMHIYGAYGEHKMIKQRCANNVTCYAARPGQLGCMLRMMLNYTCSVPFRSKATLGPKKVKNPRFAKILQKGKSLAKKASFLAITEDWNEAICQFHQQFGGQPRQDQFQNVRLGKKKTTVADLSPTYNDPADEQLYEFVKQEYERRKLANSGGDQCYEYVNTTSTAETSQCVPKTCQDMGKQCGEWPDGCGGLMLCGICNVGPRDGLPDTWRFQCSWEGICIRTCPPWEEAGLWHRPLSPTQSNTDQKPQEIVNGQWKEKLKGIGPGMADRIVSSEQKYLYPTDAVKMCISACANMELTKDPDSTVFADRFCICGVKPKEFLERKLNPSYFDHLYNLNPSNDFIFRHKPWLGWFDANATQPKCCQGSNAPPQNNKGNLPPYSRWVKGIPFADYFMSFQLGCSGRSGCEQVGHKYNASVVSHDPETHMCYLGRNYEAGPQSVMQIDHEQRYFLQLRSSHPEKK